MSDEEIKKLKEDFAKMKEGLTKSLAEWPETLEKQKRINQKATLLLENQRKLSEEEQSDERKGDEPSEELVATCMKLICNYADLLEMRSSGNTKLNQHDGNLLKRQLESEVTKVTVIHDYVSAACVEEDTAVASLDDSNVSNEDSHDGSYMYSMVKK